MTLFAWMATKMSRIDINIAFHKLNVKKDVCPIKKKMWKTATLLVNPIKK